MLSVSFVLVFDLRDSALNARLTRGTFSRFQRLQVTSNGSARVAPTREPEQQCPWARCRLHPGPRATATQPSATRQSVSIRIVSGSASSQCLGTKSSPLLPARRKQTHASTSRSLVVDALPPTPSSDRAQSTTWPLSAERWPLCSRSRPGCFCTLCRCS